MVKDSGVPTVCCDDEMVELVPLCNDEGGEKHVPVIKVDGNVVEVTVGSKLHPSVAEHYIEWVLLQTDKGLHKRFLSPGEPPKVDFAILRGERVEAAYEYCSVHRLWKATVNGDC